MLAGRVTPPSALEREPFVSQREPIFNVPGVVLGLLVAFFVVYLLRSVLPTEQNAWLTDVLAFIPARMDGLAADLPGGRIAAVTSFVTYQFVHGDLTHLLINSAWLLAVGTPVARRTDPIRFLAFFLMAGVAGAVAFLAVKGSIPIRVVGASGAISGLMGATFRFMFRSFENGGLLGLANPRVTPLMSLGETLSDQRVFMAIAGWTLLNVLFALWGGPMLTDADGIAWEAHLGGFFAGLLLYGFFERPPPDPEGDDVAVAE